MVTVAALCHDARSIRAVCPAAAAGAAQAFGSGGAEGVCTPVREGPWHLRLQENR